MKTRPPDRRAAARRAALRALRKAARAADRAGISLTEWEGEFLGSVESRVETFGRAFADPAKGEAGSALSALQRIKLKEIAAKAHPKAKSDGPPKPGGLKRRRGMNRARAR